MLHREPTKKPGDFSLGSVHEFLVAFGRQGGTPAMLQSLQENELFMKRLLDRYHASGTGYQFSEQEQLAYRLLGRERLLHPGLASLAWGHLDAVYPEIPYTEETLMRCAEENNGGDRETPCDFRDPAGGPYNRKWYLVYLTGQSFEDTVQAKQHKSRGHYDRFLANAFAKARPAAGYRLISYRSVCGFQVKNTRQVHDELLAALGEKYERASLAMICETAITLASAFGSHRANLNRRHWGDERCQDGHYLSVSVRDIGVTSVDFWLEAIDPNKELDQNGSPGVCLYRKPDF